MQTIKEMQDVTESNTHLSGYELTHLTIHNLGRYDLTPTAKLVLVFLTTHYNEGKNGNVVFPSMPYIAETLGIGLTATKKAIKDLIDDGFILKSKRNKVRGNLNKYGLSPKLKNQKATILNGQNSTPKQSENEPFKRSESDLFMITNNKKLNKETTTTKSKVVVASFNSSSKTKTVKLEDVPKLIRNKKDVKNPCAYWASLSEEVKAEYLLKEKEAEEKKERLAKQKAEEEARKEEERKIAEEERNKPPFYAREEYTRVEGLEHVARLPKMFHLRSTIAKEIIARFGLTEAEIEQKRAELIANGLMQMA